MSERGVDRSNGAGTGASASSPARSSLAWIGGGALGAVAVVALLLMVIRTPGSPSASGGAPATSTSSTTSTTSTTLDPSASGIVPTDRVAYLTADGRVLSGDGAETPVEIASGAALGPTGLGALAVAPTGDLVAYVRNDGALVAVPVRGGEPTVLATDAVTADLGVHPSLAWDPTGARIAYLAVGTPEMVAPRSDLPPALSALEGVFRAPLPEGVLGNVVKVADREGAEIVRIGDPSTRSMVGVVSSQSDDFMLLESVNPEDGAPYTLAVGTSGSGEATPTVLSADDPTFSPDGNFIVAVGPDKSGQELIRVATDSFGRTTLVSTDNICAPAVSPDSTRIVYGSGPDCSRLMVVSARGGTPVEITPPALPGSATYRYGQLSWTAEGHFVVFADCRSTDGPVRCGGPVTFLDPDRRLVIPGAEATTVATVGRPLLGDLTLAVILDGPIEYAGTFPVTAEVESELIDVSESTARIEADLVDGDRQLGMRLQVEEGNEFVTGQLTIVDPTAGIDRTFLVLGTATAIGVRVVSVSGIWISTDDLPVASGEFRLAVRRG